MGKDLERKQARQREYNRNPKNRARRKALEATPERKAAREAWATMNKSKTAAWMKTYNARPEVKKQTSIRQLRARHTPKGRAQSLLRGVRYRCKKFGLVYDLNEDAIADAIVDTVCPYTMQSFVLSKGRHPFAPSIDRIDGTKGYTSDNIQVVSFWWNIAKNVWPEHVTATVLLGLRKALQDMIIE